MSSLTTDVKYALIVAGVITALILLSMAIKPAQAMRPMVDKMKRQTAQARHLLDTSRQDRNIVLALVHATAALCKLQTVRRLFDQPGEAQQHLGVDLDSMITEATNYHQRVLDGFSRQKGQLPPGTVVNLEAYLV